MDTVNISLPEELNKQVNRAIKNEGYASRSEFFRTLIRLYFTLKASDNTQKDDFFISFEKQPLGEIKEDLSATGKYSSTFINSVVKGLGKSSLYSKK